MSASYGPFLLRHIRGDAVETEAQCLDVLDQFARMGFCERFCEIVGERVVEFHDGVGEPAGVQLYRWLEGEAAARVLALRRVGGSAPYSYFAFLDGLATLFTPEDYAERASAELNLATGTTYSFTAMPTPQAVLALARINERLKGKAPDFWQHYDDPLETYLEFHDALAQQMTRCAEAGVLYVFGD